MSVKPINIGVVGVGHLGIHHVKHYTTIPNVNLLGIYDPDIKRSNYVANKYKTVAFQKSKKIDWKCRRPICSNSNTKSLQNSKTVH